MHPAPNSLDRPSFASLVGSIDSDAAKYVATMRVQKSRKEEIDDFEAMAKVCQPHAQTIAILRST
jgi:eukaryotic translation initiation factor 2C